MEASIDEPPSLLLFVAAILLDSSTLYFVYTGLILAFLLLFSALVSGSEVAFFSLKNDDLEACAKSKSARDHIIVKLLDAPKHLLATILILNNFINVGFVTAATFVIWRLVGPTAKEDWIIVGATTIVVTILLVFFGEIVPKVYATKMNLTFARKTARMLQFMSIIFKPLAWILMKMSNIIEKRFKRHNYSVSVDELNQALEMTTDENTPEDQKEILRGIVNFGTISVKQIMTSRVDMIALDCADNFHEVMDRINKSGFSRIPVYDESMDKIEGILYIKDLIPHLDQDDNFEWKSLIRPGYFVPETKKINALLKDFQAKHVHIAIVVDEYGGTSGLITLEDIIEEIVGEINDEFDESVSGYVQLDEQTFEFEGKTQLMDFCKIIGEDPALFEKVKGENDSLGGLLLEINSRLPNAGDTLSFDRFDFTVKAVDHKRIKKIIVTVGEKNKGEEDQ